MSAERRSASLDARAERLASLLTLSTEAMLVWHLDEGIEFWNSGAERLYGFTSEEAVGRTSHALLQTKFPVEFIELITRLRNERHWSGELRHICKPIFAKLNSICFFWRQLFSLATMQS
jgi:PAS domain S-box-containing protein